MFGKNTRFEVLCVYCGFIQHFETLPGTSAEYQFKRQFLLFGETDSGDSPKFLV